MTTKNRYFRRSKISEAKFRQIIRHFALDLTATECACYLDRHPKIYRWLRNTVRSDNSFWLQLPTAKFYPDFVALLEDGRILVVEYKGGYLY